MSTPPLAGAVSRALSGLTAIFLSAAALGACSLAILQTFESRLGDYSLAAYAVGAFSLGNAAGLVLQGRCLDHVRARSVLLGASIVFCSITVGIVALRPAHVTLSICALAVAGASVPAVTGAIRASVPSSYPTERHLLLYAAISVVFQAGMALGPLIPSVLYPVRAQGWSFAAIAALTAVATVLTWGHDPQTTARPHPSPPPVRASARLFSHGYVTILLATAGIGVATGVVSVGLPATLAAIAPPTSVSVAFTVLAVGELAAGLVYGARRWPGTLATHLCTSLLLLTIASSALAFTTSTPLLTVIVMGVLGAAGAPAGIALSALLDVVVPTARLTTAFTTMVAVNLISAAVGSGVAGVGMGITSPSAVLVLAPLTVFTTLIVVTGRRRVLRA